MAKKNMDWINTYTQWSLKNYQLDRWSSEEKKIFSNLKPTIDTIDPKLKTFNQWIDTIGGQHD
jgi:hypothetical protein